MAFRRIPKEDRINAIKECIRIENTKEMAIKYGISEATLISDCNDLINETEEMLKKRSLVGRLKSLLKKVLLKFKWCQLKIKKRIIRRHVRIVNRKKLVKTVPTRQ